MVVAVAAVWILWPFWHLSLTFADHAPLAPTRVYAQPWSLTVGRLLEVDRLETALADLGYRPRASGLPAPGEYVAGEHRWLIHRRSFPARSGLEKPALLELGLRRGHIASLTERGRSVGRTSLEPPLLATLVGSERRERRPVDLESLPEDLVEAVLAAEDAGFFGHAGLSVTGISRAAWRNVSRDGPLQGGSTLTQQLVKNLYLTHERTLARKLREAVLAVLIELRYEKRDILEAYLNEIYWGQSGGANLMGVGAAARAFFGKDADHLALGEAATLAGVIKAPNYFSPVRHPERARSRRDWVLHRMHELEWLSEQDCQRARRAPLEARPQRVVLRRAPYFVERALAEVRQRFDLDAAVEGGLSVLTTLDWHDQQQAETAVGWGLEALEKGWEQGRRKGAPLQAALVSVAAESGEIRAWVGGRDYRASQFDRASSARRQAGSAFKPVVYAAALAAGMVTPASMVPDEPLAVRSAGVTWEPQNDDRDFRGWVSVRTALERSLNVPTARVALEVGLDRVLEMARSLGVGGRLRPFPALALGAFEVTPEELTQVYTTLAAAGTRRQLHSIRAVLDRSHAPVSGEPLPEPEQVLSPQVAYVLASLLQGVVERGTAGGVRDQGLDDPLAGKTGTTNGRRDSWFGGYSPDRATLVWVGYDDNRETRLSGARAALPIWAHFAAKVRPPGGFDDFSRPPGIETAMVDADTGLRATLYCPRPYREVFVGGQAPWRFCFVHERAGRGRHAISRDLVREVPERQKRGFWKRLFGRKGGKKKDDG